MFVHTENRFSKCLNNIVGAPFNPLFPDQYRAPPQNDESIIILHYWPAVRAEKPLSVRNSHWPCRASIGGATWPVDFLHKRASNAELSQDFILLTVTTGLILFQPDRQSVKDKMDQTDPEVWQQLAEVMTPSIVKVVEFAKQVPGFTQVRSYRNKLYDLSIRLWWLLLIK